VKLHRKDRLEYYEKVIQKCGQSKIHFVTDRMSGFPSSIFDWLQGCGVLLTGASTTAIEALLVDVPVVTMDFAGELNGVDFIEMGATTHVRSYTELEEKVGALLHSKELRGQTRDQAAAFLQEMFFALDGRSAERAADELIKLSPHLQRQATVQ
jgi:hypothetical protein